MAMLKDKTKIYFEEVSRDSGNSYSEGYSRGYSEAMSQMQNGNSGHYPMKPQWRATPGW